MRDGIYIDCETTGLRGDDRICELTLATVRGWEVENMVTWRYNPGMPVSPEAAKVNGLNWERDLAHHPAFDPDQVLAILDGELPAVAYSCHFDKRMLEQEFRRAGKAMPDCKWIDAYQEAKARLGLPRHRQVDVAKHFGIDTTGSHSAERDVQILIDICRGLDGAEAPAPAVAQPKDAVLRDFALRLRQTLDVTIELEAVTEYDSVVIDSAINNLQAMKNELDKERKLIVAEPTAFVRAVNGEFKKVKDGIDKEKARLDGLVKGYLMKQEKVVQPATKPAVGSAVREKTYNIMYAHVDLSKVDMRFMKLDEFAVECEIKRQVAEGIDPPRIAGVPLEMDYVVKRRAR